MFYQCLCMLKKTLQIHITLTYIISKLHSSFSWNFDVFHNFMIQISMTTTGYFKPVIVSDFGLTMN